MKRKFKWIGSLSLSKKSYKIQYEAGDLRFVIKWIAYLIAGSKDGAVLEVCFLPHRDGFFVNKGKNDNSSP